MYPKVSIIWLNYNSTNFLNLVLTSLRSVFNLDYEKYEVIIVDNASNDGSFERIKNFVETERPGSIKVKFVRSDRNRGYSGGMNLGWDARDPESKYVVFLNNDLIVEQDSLKRLVEYVESDYKVGAASGLIYFGDGKQIYSAGGVVTELWNAGGICWGLLEGECYKKDKPHRVSYADGAYMIISVNAIKDASPIGKPFLDRAFLYFDDYVLGLLLWNRGWRVKYYPIRAGLHFAHRTTRPALNYYGVRAHVALMNIVKTWFQPLSTFYLLRRLSIHSLMCVKGESNSCNIVRAIYDGLRLGFYAKQKIGNLILYEAPYVKSALKEIECLILGICEELKITYRDVVG